MGQALRAGFNSHFVLTNKHGLIYNTEDKTKNERMCNGMKKDRILTFVIAIR
jgi:hypothetical protein